MEEYFKAVKITEKVYWVGAIDWSVRNFHGYETGRGSTYNAFLVLDEKITLIDTVKAPFVPEMLARIRSVIGDVTKVDYVVSNHAEPDHSGGLPATVAAVKPEKVFASAIGHKTLMAYYGDLGVIPVKNGEAINLGRSNLAFVETKMLQAQLMLLPQVIQQLKQYLALLQLLVLLHCFLLHRMQLNSLWQRILTASLQSTVVVQVQVFSRFLKVL